MLRGSCGNKNGKALAACDAMIEVFSHNCDPSLDEMQEIAEQHGLECEQVNSWFVTRRSRYLSAAEKEQVAVERAAKKAFECAEKKRTAAELQPQKKKQKRAAPKLRPAEQGPSERRIASGNFTKEQWADTASSAEVEKLRMANMARNQELLKQLGLA